MIITKDRDNLGIKPDKTKNNSSTFLLPALKLDKHILANHGFVNCYINDQDHDSSYKNCIYLLFNNKEGDLISSFDEIINYIELQHKIIEVYDIEYAHTVIVVKFPSNFIKDLKLFKEGKYSKFSKEYKDIFPKEKITNGVKENTLYYHIFNKTEWLKGWWAKRLGYEDEKEFSPDEFWEYPQDCKEVLRYKK